MLAFLAGSLLLTAAPSPQGSVFLPPPVVARCRANVSRDPVLASARDAITKAAAPWLAMPDDEIWALMFGSTIRRSWMVWSNGHCPSCKRDVPMYTWEIAAIERPWKVRCPHCHGVYPKNDFGAFYRSGLDEHGVFDPVRANRSLLVNAEHPGADDPLRTFGVDDGEGFQSDGHRWRFIGAYLIYGHWKQLIVAGARKLADAYALTGDARYAHKAGILLDRVADLYPDHDFGRQGVMYEGPPMAGYVSTWHDACEETRALALAYDTVREALARDASLVLFLSARASHHRLANAKTSWEKIRANIETGLLRHPIANPARIHSNYPRTEVALATLHMVLGWPANRAEVMAIIDPMITKATAVDGVTGEKGLAGYTTYTIRGVADFLARIARMDPSEFAGLVKRHPRIRDMFRFHIDTWCLGRYYPQIGDTGAYAIPFNEYAAVDFPRAPSMEPSAYDFLMRLSEATGDPEFVQALYLANGCSLAGLPFDLFGENAARFQAKVKAVIAKRGVRPTPVSTLKAEWRLAVLKSGRDTSERAVWLNFDSGGGHGHMDALNLGLFAHGLDLMPEFGYPPVQFGGWGSERARWYTMTAAHNTLVVDDRNQKPASGSASVYADGESFHAVVAECAAAAEIDRFERAVTLCDVDPGRFYVLDVLRATGGREHVRHMQSHFGPLTISGAAPAPYAGPGPAGQMRGLRLSAPTPSGWSAEWTVDDRRKLGPTDTQVRVRYSDASDDSQVGSCEAWLAVGGYNETLETWIPRLVMRRTSQTDGLRSTFAGVIDPYLGAPTVARAVRRAAAGGVAIEVLLDDGTRDVYLLADRAGSMFRAADDSTDAAIAFMRFDSKGRPVRFAMTGGSECAVAGVTLRTAPGAFVEGVVSGGTVRVVRRVGGDLISAARDGKPLQVK